MQSDKARLEEQCMLEAQGLGLTRILLDSANKVDHRLCENILGHRAQYDRELVEFWYERDYLQAWLANSDSPGQAFCESQPIFREHLKAYRRASIS